MSSSLTERAISFRTMSWHVYVLENEAGRRYVATPGASPNGVCKNTTKVSTAGPGHMGRGA